ncbi:cysteine--tRNA ligase [Megalodesulfovibrio gigas]|uniref:Cysteine--tRNA ligase n=1 Tax=Megalodesulfovibrio gigas (strain ATCC 19364 / DSM 1382 / NCIMB 9332 / VKM B-1759) TaxID=1121448 RepID=T2GG00_MEGG1|nr:cysteine--tRNA ligase [Megalodesulfovibrio gigas]AGW15081.1 putative cysteinyl-tRNA synthetase [Megalodesulfovibrio gigas DSM 1382 = ATCC 19364]
MRLYNTLTRSKEPFTPAEPGKVRLYVCGITAYDLCHVGHARSAVVFDVLVRALTAQGLDVIFARNFTDVDDKIINRANELGEDPNALAQRYIQAFYEDMDALNVRRATLEPKATEHIDEMIQLCQDLIAKNAAYATPGGDVYFRVRAYQAYGELSGRNIEELEAGARVAPGEEKEDPLDFALWKAAKPGEPSWSSPWGPGRPGWHTECSAMSEKYFTLPLDIHGGGQDLIFPHHENEMAQTGASRGQALARFWMHNGFVQIDSEKMSKSLGNFKTIRDIIAQYLPETLRFFLITKHYRSPIDFTTQAMEEAEKNLIRIYTAMQAVEEALANQKWNKTSLPDDVLREFADIKTLFDEAMADDMNTAAALGHVFGLVRLVNRVLEDKGLRKSEQGKAFFEETQDALAAWGEILGVFQQPAAAFLQQMRDVRVRRAGIDPARVEALLLQRQEAKKAKDFAAADAVREELTAMGVDVRDTPQGPAWDVH